MIFKDIKYINFPLPSIFCKFSSKFSSRYSREASSTPESDFIHSAYDKNKITASQSANIPRRIVVQHEQRRRPV